MLARPLLKIFFLVRRKSYENSRLKITEIKFMYSQMSVLYFLKEHSVWKINSWQRISAFGNDSNTVTLHNDVINMLYEHTNISPFFLNNAIQILINSFMFTFDPCLVSRPDIFFLFLGGRHKGPNQCWNIQAVEIPLIFMNIQLANSRKQLSPANSYNVLQKPVQRPQRDGTQAGIGFGIQFSTSFWKYFY